LRNTSSQRKALPMVRRIALSLISRREAKFGWRAAALMFPHPWSSENPQSLRGIDNFGVQRSEFYHINFLIVTTFSDIFLAPIKTLGRNQTGSVGHWYLFYAFNAPVGGTSWSRFHRNREVAPTEKPPTPHEELLGERRRGYESGFRPGRAWKNSGPLLLEKIDVIMSETAGVAKRKDRHD